MRAATARRVRAKPPPRKFRAPSGVGEADAQCPPARLGASPPVGSAPAAAAAERGALGARAPGCRRVSVASRLDGSGLEGGARRLCAARGAPAGGCSPAGSATSPVHGTAMEVVDETEALQRFFEGRRARRERSRLLLTMLGGGAGRRRLPPSPGPRPFPLPACQPNCGEPAAADGISVPRRITTRGGENFGELAASWS